VHVELRRREVRVAERRLDRPDLDAARAIAVARTIDQAVIAKYGAS
jgi:hypothetical protein